MQASVPKSSSLYANGPGAASVVKPTKHRAVALYCGEKTRYTFGWGQNLPRQTCTGSSPQMWTGASPQMWTGASPKCGRALPPNVDGRFSQMWTGASPK
eukprot:1522496-Pleurochrysis_carterae.AAC.1